MFDDIASLLPELREFYEDLHRHPELSFAEVRTSAIMAQRLSDLGYEVTAGVGRTGVVATLDNGEGHTVLLRADIDALPVKEETGLSYASTATGIDADGVEVPVAHACGHDMHATWMIGVATQLATHRDLWRGKVILAIQPAEEIGGGAIAMIEDGLFERFGTPVVALGQHVTPAPAGWVLFRPGAVMTASDALKIVLHGRGAHGSAPEQAVDPVVMAASTIMKLQTVVSRNIAATDAAVVTVGTVRAGTKENIISDRAELTLSVRTFEPSVRDKVLDAISRIAHGEAHSCGAEQPPDITTLYSFPAVTNDAATTTTVGEAFVEHFGADRAMEGPVATASEDFGLYGSRGGFPSMFWFVGGADPVTWEQAFLANRINEDIPFNHSPRYAPIQDPTMTTGIEAMLVAAMCWLGHDPVA
jgi:amidohydrolase